MRRILAACCVLALVAADEKKADELQGVWKIVTIAMNGDDPKPPPVEGKFSFLPEGKLATQVGDDKREATYTLDATKKPKLLDFTPTDGPFKGKTAQAIYSLDGDTLTICMGFGPDVPRPTEIATKKDSKVGVYVLKREKK